MASKEVNFNVADSLSKLGKQLENIAPRLEEEANRAIQDVAYAAYASIVAKAQSLGNNKDDYMSGLSFQDLGGNSFLIALKGEAAERIEEGWASYNLSDVLLKSNAAVSAGPRAGEPWVQTGKQGQKFAHVPMSHKSSVASSGDLASSIKTMTAQNAAGREQRITQIFKGLNGEILQGKVATSKSDNPLLNNLTKYQTTVQSKSGKLRVQSTYLTFRTVSSIGKAWKGAANPGLQAFPEAEREIAASIEQIIKTFLRE